MGYRVRLGATWLDRELVAPNSAPMRDAGFGREVRDAQAPWSAAACVGPAYRAAGFWDGRWRWCDLELRANQKRSHHHLLIINSPAEREADHLAEPAYQVARRP